MNLFEKSNQINESLYDLKAEYLAACILREGISRTNILATFDGDLKRRYSTDISKTEVENNKRGSEDICIYLNRFGIYDLLPESLFHSFSNNRNASGHDMAKESIQLKAEEKRIRSFFQVFDNEIFLQRTQVAMVESEMLENIYSNFLNGLAPGFWKMDERIPLKYISKLVYYIPFAQEITGDTELTALCLENILDEKVTIEISNKENTGDDSGSLFSEVDGGRLGKSKLGLDLIMGQNASGFIGKIIFKIGPLKNIEPKDFFVNGSIYHLLQSFYNYFIPFELDVETKLIMPEDKLGFSLSPDSESDVSFLGYNTSL